LKGTARLPVPILSKLESLAPTRYHILCQSPESGAAHVIGIVAVLDVCDPALDLQSDVIALLFGKAVQGIVDRSS